MYEYVSITITFMIMIIKVLLPFPRALSLQFFLTDGRVFLAVVEMSQLLKIICLEALNRLLAVGDGNMIG